MCLTEVYFSFMQIEIQNYGNGMGRNVFLIGLFFSIFLKSYPDLKVITYK